MWTAHAWTLAHLTAASILHTALAWLCPRNSTGPGVEPMLTTHHTGTRTRAQLTAHPVGLHTPSAGISSWRELAQGQHCLHSQGDRHPSTTAPTPPGPPSEVCLWHITERSTQEVKHLLPDSVSPPSSPAQQRSRSLRVGGGGEGGAGRRNRSHSVHHVLLSTIKTTPLG